MSSSTVIREPPVGLPDSAGAHAAPADDPNRVRKLEEEVLALRDTMSRFAELVLGEIKQIKNPAPALGGAPGAVPVPELPLPDSSNTRRPWLLVELFRDVATTLRMYLDPRYRVRRSTQILVPLILALFVANHFVSNLFPILLDRILEKVGDIILAVILYKVVSREITRYREAMTQYAAWESMHSSQPRTRVLTNDAEAPHTELVTQ
jgi:hypothetical protein